MLAEISNPFCRSIFLNYERCYTLVLYNTAYREYSLDSFKVLIDLSLDFAQSSF